MFVDILGKSACIHVCYKRQLHFYSRQLPLSVDQHRWLAFSLSDDAAKSGLQNGAWRWFSASLA